ncbi:hypothetical protein DSN97_02100 [Deferribacteraceae bacterium V6Fe1]|nr:hypothetical protein DSN97_02100 [Deferribacteraceae bacterium V6Fe1]
MTEIYILDEQNYIIETKNVKDNVIGKNYFDFSYDEILIKILKNMFSKVRANKKIFSTTYRCDNDDYIRYFELNIIPLNNGQIKLEHILTKQTKREKSLKDFTQSSKLYKMCAWCNKILVNDKFIEIEHAINNLKIFDEEGIPNFTHGLCESCKRQLEDEINLYESSKQV